jgi:hypothetical protein
MSSCTKCGTPVPPAANFCGACGTPVTANVQATASYMPEPLEYTIQGDNLQIARISLRNGQEVYAEAGKMVYKTPNVNWDTRMTGNTLGEKLLGALRRTVTGESLFVTYFRASGAERPDAARCVSFRAAVRTADRCAGQEARRGILRRRRIHPRTAYRTRHGFHSRRW